MKLNQIEFQRKEMDNIQNLGDLRRGTKENHKYFLKIRNDIIKPSLENYDLFNKKIISFDVKRLKVSKQHTNKLQNLLDLVVNTKS